VVLTLVLALPWLRQSVAGFSQRGPEFNPTAVHVGYVLDKVAVGRVFLPGFQISPVNIISPMFHIHSSIYHQHCIKFFSQHFSFPCQYHSSNAPYSFIHLPPTLYNVLHPELQFPLTVSFHQSSIRIHSSTTNAV